MVYIVAVISAIAWHIAYKKYWGSCFLSTMTSTLLSFMLLSSHFGWVDKVFFKNLLIVISVSFVISVVIGVLVSMVKIKDKEKR